MNRFLDGSIWLGNPDLAVVFVGHEPDEELESAGELVDCDEVSEVRAQLSGPHFHSYRRRPQTKPDQ